MKAYRFLAYMIAVLVVVQAAAIAWAFFGMTNWLMEDPTNEVTKKLLECEENCPSIGAAEWGFAIHMFFNGVVLIPLTSLVLLIVSFFAKVPGGVKYAAIIVGLVILQVFVLPELSREVGSGFGALHGLNAMLLLGTAIMAGRRVDVVTSAGGPPATTGDTSTTATPSSTV